MKLQSLVTSLVDDVPDGSLIRLYNCATVNDLILARVTAVPNNCLSISSSNSNKVALYVQKDIFPIESPSPRSDLQTVLWDRYGDCLEAEHFSRRDGTFQSFSKKESGLIDNAFSRPDNEDD